MHKNSPETQIPSVLVGFPKLPPSKKSRVSKHTHIYDEYTSNMAAVTVLLTEWRICHPMGYTPSLFGYIDVPEARQVSQKYTHRTWQPLFYVPGRFNLKLISEAVVLRVSYIALLRVGNDASLRINQPLNPVASSDYTNNVRRWSHFLELC